MYGIPGCGKTSLIKSMLTVSTPDAEISTDEYDVYENEVTISLKPLQKRSIAIADYKGDKPSQIKVNPPEEFFGIEGQRLINAIIFVVDMFPRFIDEMGNPLNPEKTKDVVLESCERNATKLIKNRVRDIEIYISKWAIEEIFTVAHSTQNLRYVRLVINKMDLLRAVVEEDYIPNVTLSTLDNYAIKLYKEIEKKIRRACDDNSISDFSVCLLSAATGENVDSVLGEILNVRK